MSLTKTPSDMLSYLPSGTGAVATTVKKKLGEIVSVKDFGAVGDGVTDDQPAIQAALNTGRGVYLPNGIYRINAPLKIATTGQKLYGESKQNTYLTTAAGSTHDLVRVAASLAEVTGILFRPGSSSNVCVRIYAGWCYLHDNRFLSGVSGAGRAVVLTDQDPDGGTVAGAYTHRIEGNYFGTAGYAFSRDIDDDSVNGITATKFMFNQHFSDNPLRLSKGGGNTYVGNLFQSATGTSGAKSGLALDFGANVTNETVQGNYFELYSYAIYARNTNNTYQSFKATHNHYDNVATVYSTANTNVYVDDAVNLAERKNGWTDDYSSTTLRKFNGVSGGTVILTLDDTNKAVLTNKRYSTPTTLSFTADSQTQTPASEYVFLTGAGAARASCVLGKTGVQDGQRLVLLAQSWAVTLTNTNIRFASGAASVQFGGTAGQVQAMELIYSSAYGMWIEVCRTVY